MHSCVIACLLRLVNVRSDVKYVHSRELDWIVDPLLPHVVHHDTDVFLPWICQVGTGMSGPGIRELAPMQLLNRSLVGC